MILQIRIKDNFNVSGVIQVQEINSKNVAHF